MSCSLCCDSTRRSINHQRPSWGDVKKFVKSKQLFDEDEMEDSDFKVQLKELAIKIAVEVAHFV